MTLATFQDLQEVGAAERTTAATDDETCWRLIANPGDYDKAYRPPLVSIVITAHNYEEYVAQCLRSVHRQTYSRFECVVVDDCSRDDTRAVAEELIANWDDPRFRLVAPPHNLGQLGAQCYGFARTTGHFVVFVDADDLLLPAFVERHLYAHLNLPTVVGFTSSDQWNIDAAGAVLAFHHPDLIAGLQSGEGSHVVARAYQGDERALEGVIFAPCGVKEGFGSWWWGTQSTMMFRRDLLATILPDAADADAYRTCADFYLARFAQLLSASAILREALGSYRRHGRNNFCSNPLAAADVPVGDMRRHPRLEAFYSLALRVIEARRETYLGMLGQQRFEEFVAGFERQLIRSAPRPGNKRWLAPRRKSRM